MEQDPGVSLRLWGRAGRAYYALDEDRIVAILYCGDSTSGEQSVSGDAASDTRPGWRLVLSNDPDHHKPVDLPPVEPGMITADVDAIVGEALVAASALLDELLDGNQ